MINFLKPKTKAPLEGHVVVTNSESGETIIHIWRGDQIHNGYSLKVDQDQARMIRDELVHKFGV